LTLGLAELARLEADLEAAHAASRLPEEPPWEEMAEFIVGLRLGPSHNP
jgi:hypothetical protein